MEAAGAIAPEPVLSISIVTYEVEEAGFLQSLKSLSSAVDAATEGGVLSASQPVSLTIVDNSRQEDRLRGLVEPLQNSRLHYEIIGGIKNIGYGRAHNLAILTSKARYHLILNPDVLLDENSLVEGLAFLQSRPDVSGLAPFATDAENNPQFLCKSFPNLFDLFLRGFAPASLKQKFRDRLARYEMQDSMRDQPVEGVPLISGCFMLCDAAKLKLVGGFDERYFLYFEDFALSMELRKHGPLAYLPSMKIRHFGGNSARKGLRHIFMFASSGIKFFNTYGWKLI